MSHQIEVKDVVGGISTIELAGSFGKGDHKELLVEVNINLQGVIYWEYVVLDKRVPVYKGQSVSQAVQAYNNL
jgi:hypothetical protein